MGFVEIYQDGVYIKLESGEVTEMGTTFRCDSCDKERPTFGSEIVSFAGVELIQVCKECKPKIWQKRGQRTENGK